MDHLGQKLADLNTARDGNGGTGTTSAALTFAEVRTPVNVALLNLGMVLLGQK
jgi:hypothetical protein